MRTPLKLRYRREIRDAFFFFSRIFFDPFAVTAAMGRRIRAMPIFFANLIRYTRTNERRSLRFSLPSTWFRTYDRFDYAASLTTHYFFQDLWAASNIFDSGVRKHVDVASRVDGFVAEVLPFCQLTYVDIRPLDLKWPTFEFRQGSIASMPFEDDEVHSLSCLHVIEHVGLGRYGDPIDPEGPWKAARELVRVLAPGGKLLVSAPVGSERLCFDAHRVFAPATLRSMFSDLDLVEFSFIDDRNRLIRNADLAEAGEAYFGCGLFELRKPVTSHLEPA